MDKKLRDAADRLLKHVQSREGMPKTYQDDYVETDRLDAEAMQIWRELEKAKG
jgi:hypothetical protein